MKRRAHNRGGPGATRRKHAPDGAAQHRERSRPDLLYRL